MLEYLAHDTTPPDEHKERVTAAKAYLKWQNGELLIKKGDNWLRIPSIAQRSELIEERHVLLAHAGSIRTADSLKDQFYWNNMYEMAGEVID